MESTNEKNQTANKWFNDANSTVMDMCNKQANLVFGFYNNLFNSMPGMNKNNWMPNMNFSHDGHQTTNPFFSAFNMFKATDFMNSCASQYQDMYKQMADYNSLWNSFIQKKSQVTQENCTEAAQKIQAIVEKEWKVRGDMAHTMIDAYNKQMEFSTELNKKFMEELNNHFNKALKRNEAFYSDAFKETPTADKEEKEHEPVAVKKHAKAEPAHAQNHNHNHHK